MVIKNVCIITGLEIESQPIPFQYKGLHLLKIPQLIDEHFIVGDFIKSIGSRYYQELRESVYFLNLLDIKDLGIEYIGGISSSTIDTLDAFCSALWFIKDNSCDVDKNYTLIADTDRYSMVQIHTTFTNCHGEYKPTFFSNSELNKASEILNQLVKITGKPPTDKEWELYKQSLPDKTGIYDGISNKIEYSIRNRIERAYLFLRSVRQSNFILFKISLYMNVIECLFTTDSTEVSHKIAERVSCYCSNELEERKIIFKLIKHAYGIRSKYFHGQSLDKKIKMEDIKETLTKVDDLIRTIFNKVIMVDHAIFLKDSDEMERYFVDLILK